MKTYSRSLSLLLAYLFLAGTVCAQERFSIFVGSDPSNVERMLKLADLKDSDLVMDLGSGDGRIVIGAALMNPKLKGIGVEIDAKLVTESTQAAVKHGVSDRIQFLHQNAFDADLSNVSVIFMWLWPEMQTMLRPKILREARAGTRVVTNVWDLGSWQPDETDANGAQVSLWVVPARIEGSWAWELPVRGQKHQYSAIFEQRFQRAEGFARAGKRRALLRDVKLKGDDVTVALDMTLDGVGFARHEFTGKVNRDAIEGSVRITVRSEANKAMEETIVLPWRARRVTDPSYFGPTGLDIL